MLSVYASAGTIQTISPSNGPYAGGNQILITGQNLGNGSDITNIVICGIRASISTQSSTQVVVWAGSKGVGTGPVTVYSTSQGVSSQTSGYTYNPPGVIGQRIPGNVIAGDRSDNEGFSMAIKGDGGIICWGSTNYNRLNDVPTPNIGFTSVAAGGKHALALRSDGVILGWGAADQGQMNVPAPNSGFSAIAAGFYHGVGLRTNGSIACWGRNDENECSVPAPNNNFMTIAAGGFHSLGLKADSSVVCWGDNSENQISVPAPNTNFVAMAAGRMHSVGLKTDGTIVCWGRNAEGQLNVPAPNTNFIAVAAGSYHSVGLKADGSVVCWGANGYGQSTAPGTNGNFLAIAAGFAHTMGLKVDGTLVCWGRTNNLECRVPAPNQDYGIYGGVGPNWAAPKGGRQITINGFNLGAGDVTNVTLCGVPVAAILSQNPTQVVVTAAAASNESIGSVTIFSVSRGITVRSNAFTYYHPGVIGTRMPGQTISAGHYHTLALRGGGVVAAWGYNGEGQCDVVAPNTNYAQVAAGYYHSLGLRADGSISCWGRSSEGQLVVPGANSGFMAISAGGYHSLGLRSDGTVATWGENANGQCNVPAPNTGFSAVAAGRYHSAGLKSDGSVVCWGDNSLGQCDVSVPNANFVAISAGDDHTMGLRADGSLACWGNGGKYTVGGVVYSASIVSFPNAGFAGVSAASGYSLGLQTNGVVRCWPIADFPPTSSNYAFRAVAGGQDGHKLALKHDGKIITWGTTNYGTRTVPWPNESFGLQPGVSPVQMPLEGGERVTITGSDLGCGDITNVFLAGVPVASIVSQCPTQVVVIAGIGTVPAPGSVAVCSVTNGVSRSTELFTYYSRLRLDGTNGQQIVSGEPVSMAKGTDFGGTTNDVTIVHTFAITNQGTNAITIAGVSTNGAGASQFTVSGMPSSLAAGATSSFTIGYSPSGVGVYTAEVAIANDTINSPYRIALRGARFVASTNMGPNSGSNILVIASGILGNGSDITNVTICGVRATIIGQTATSVTVRVGAGGIGQGDIVVQSSSAGSITVINGYRYNRPGLVIGMPEKPVLAAGLLHSLGVKSNGAIICWGRPNEGQDIVPGENSGFLSIAGGGYHSLGLRSDGAIAAWGNNEHGECNMPEPNESFVAVAGGVYHSMGLRLDGSILCWGLNEYGQANSPPDNTNFKMIAAGGWHSMGLKTDGSVVCWGVTNDDRCAVPAPNTNFVAIAGGSWHSMGLKSDGSIVCWGQNTDGRCNVPGPNTGFVAIAAGRYHSMGLKNDGSVVCWGYNGDGQCTVPGSNANFVAIAAGGYHSMGLKADGTMVCWGYGGDGQCTVPATNSNYGIFPSALVPSRSPLDGGAVIAIRGMNLGAGDVTNVTLCGIPVAGVVSQSSTQVVVIAAPSPQLTNGAVVVQSVSCGTAIRSNAFSYCSRLRINGMNGQEIITGEATSLMKGNDFSSVTPDAIIHSFSIINQDTNAISINDITTNGSGSSRFVVSGLPANLAPGASQNFTISFTSPDMGLFTSVVTIAHSAAGSPMILNIRGARGGLSAEVGPAAGGNSLTITIPGMGNGADITNVTICGIWAQILSQTSNSVTVIPGSGGSGTGDIVLTSAINGALQLPNVYTYNLPGVITTLTKSQVISAGYEHSVGLKSDGTVVCWGRNVGGKCNVPAPNSSFIAVSGGGTHSLGIKSDGSITCWGDNSSGQCNVPSPNASFVAVDAGYVHSIGLKSDGSIVCWEYNLDGQCNVPSPNANFVAVSAGYKHSMGLKSDGSVVCWGYNYKGQCNVPAPNSGFTAVSGGFWHSVGLKSDGSVVCWGDNSSGQCNVPSPNADFVAISAGDNHSMGLKSDGSVMCWGKNDYGQRNVPSPNGSFVAISGGGSHSLGLKADGSVVCWGANIYNQGTVPSPNANFAATKSVNPASSILAGGGQVTILGRNLGAGDITNVTLCGVSAFAIDSQSATQVVITAGSAPYPISGAARVYSTSYGVTVQSNAFTYYATSTAQCTYAVASTFGSPVPPVGTTTQLQWTAWTNHVDNPGGGSSTQIICSGWSLAGNEPTSGTSNYFVMVLTNNCQLTWLWSTGVLLQATTGSGGAISPTGGWYVVGSSVTLTATPPAGAVFAGWSGDVQGDTNSPAMTLTMDRSRYVTANFSNLFTDIVVTKAIDNAAPEPLDVITYTITASNAGPNAVITAAINDLLPSGVQYLNHSSGTYAASNGNWNVGALNVGASTSLVIQVRVLIPPNLMGYITNPAPTPWGNFGCSVASVGSDKVLVGADFDDAGATDTGSAYIFDINGTLLATITNPTPASGDWFGNSVAGVGPDKVVVGARHDDAGGSDAGVVYIFDLNGNLLVTITNPAPAAGDNFGISVAGVGSDKVLVGAYLDDAGATDTGSAYIFDINGTRLATITNPAPASEDYFGYSVAGLGSNKVAVGAYLDNAGASDAGSAYIFDISGNLLATITNPAPAGSDKFGYSVAGVGSNKVVVGAYQDDAGADDAGSVYIFDANGVLLVAITNPAPAEYDEFGNSVAGVGSDNVMVGAWNMGALRAGSVFTYGLTAGRAYVANTAELLSSTPTDSNPANDSSSATLFVGEENIQITLLGTNSVQIANGEAASSVKGTDFGATVWGQPLTNQFSIVNPGNAELTIVGVATSGTGSAAFAVQGMPAVVPVSSAVQFRVVFSPAVAQAYTCVVAIANNSTNTPFLLNLTGAGQKANQTITFPAIGAQITTNTVGLAATASSGLGVSFAVGSGPGTITGGTNLAFTGTGTVSIVASQAGDANWNAAPGATNVFEVFGIYFTLSVESTYGSPIPAVGIHSNIQGTIVTNSVNSQIAQGTTQYVCSGWTMTGHDPVTGSGNSFVLTLTNNASLSWNWATNYQLATGTNGNGMVDVATGWRTNGAQVAVTATAGAHWHFASWSGDTNGCGQTGNVITAAMTQARSLTAVFAPDQQTLTVTSAQGGASPGTVTTDYGTALSQWITNSPVTGSGTQYVCSGGAVVGNAYAQPSLTNVTLTLTNDASLAWAWTTNYRLAAAASGPGTVGPTGGWYALGSGVAVTAAPNANAVFAGWSGDVAGDTNSPTLALTMDRARSVVANFHSFICLVEPGNGPFRGGNQIAISANVNLGNGSDITNVTLCGVGASIQSQTATSVVVLAGASGWGTGQVVVQSTSLGTKFVQDGYTYNSQGVIGSGTGRLIGGGGDANGNYSFSAAIRRSGMVVAWGDNTYQQTNVPVGNGSYVSLAVGGRHVTGLRGDGSLYCWGDNAYGQTNLPSPNSGFVAIGVGSSHSVGLRYNGTIVCWGANSSGQCTVPAPNTNFVGVAVGRGDFSVGLKSNGTVVCWGANGSGQCTVPAPNTNFVAVAAGRTHSLGLKSDGSVVCWGANTSNQCAVPLPNTNFVAIAGGRTHSAGLKSDGTIVCWGDNTYGQCNVPSPNTNFVAIEAGANHTVGLKSDGTIVCWGRNEKGQLNVVSPNLNFGYWSGIEPNQSPLTGDVTVVVSGRNLGAGDITNVTICGVSASEITSQSPTQIVVKTGAASVAGLGDIRVYSTSSGETVKSNAFTYIKTDATLTIQSPHGMGTPATGIYTNPLNATLTNQMSATDEQGTTQYVCTGWIMTGQAPVSGFGTQLVMTVTNDATLIWQWSTNYWLDTAAGPNGLVNVSDGWQPIGITTQLTATANQYYHFANWSGSVSGANNPIEILMDGPRTILATFAANLASNNTPEWWLAENGWNVEFDSAATNDSDRDGFPAWKEYIADTDPNVSNSCPHVDFVLTRGANPVITWPSSTGRLYQIHRCDDLVIGQWITQQLSLGTGQWTDTNPPPTTNRYYRIAPMLP